MERDDGGWGRYEPPTMMADLIGLDNKALKLWGGEVIRKERVHDLENVCSWLRT